MRILLTILLGLLMTSIGIVLLGVRLVDGIPLPPGLIGLGIVSLGFGVFALVTGARDSRRVTHYRFTHTGICIQILSSLFVAAVLAWSVLSYPNEDRGRNAFIGMLGIVLFTWVTAGIAAKLGYPSEVAINPQDGDSND